MFEDEAVKRLVDLVAAAQKPNVYDIVDLSVRPEPVHVLTVATPNGGVELRSIKPFLDEYRQHPERIEGDTKALTLDSFHALINRHKNEHSAVLADTVSSVPKMVAVIDYHTKDQEPRRGRQTITYAWPISKEWKAWSGNNGTGMSQTQWAEWIEDHIPDLVSPTAEERAALEPMMQTRFAEPVDMVTLSRGMTVTVESKLKDIRTLQSGEAVIQFEEVHRDGSGEKLVVPGLFMIAIPLFVGAEPSRLVARLRYRKKDSGLVWFYQFHRVEQMIAEQLERDAIDVGVTCDIPVWQATR